MHFKHSQIKNQGIASCYDDKMLGFNSNLMSNGYENLIEMVEHMHFQLALEEKLQKKVTVD
jgi:hypothetical protein